MLAKLLIDENLGRLSRWLRFLGFDAVFAMGLEDEEVASFALCESRVLITRDKELCEQYKGPIICVRQDDLRKQIFSVLKAVGVPDQAHWFSRCTECNKELVRLTSEEIHQNSKIPNSVKIAGRACWQCPRCHKVYWQGTHYDRALRFLIQVHDEVSMVKSGS